MGSNYVLDLILVDYEPALTSEEEIIELIAKAGYKAIRSSRTMGI